MDVSLAVAASLSYHSGNRRRPYLYGALPAEGNVYTELAGCSKLRRAHPSNQSATARWRSTRDLERPPGERAAARKNATSETDTVPRAVSVEGRIHKLGNTAALEYPRLGPRPHRMTIPAFRQKYRDPSSTPADDEIVLEGRITAVRRAGSKLLFINILGGYEEAQLTVSYGRVSEQCTPEEFKILSNTLRRGDIISVAGKAVRNPTKDGSDDNGPDGLRRLALSAVGLPKVLAPGLASLPTKLINEETKILNRHVDLLVNKRASDTLRLRSHVIKYLRDFFHNKDFLEVQTPILADSAGGAAARPFITSATEFPEKELALRIAPELWLKRLVIGGNDKVFEIGPAFRNEGLDTTHNPEFTMCEFYSAYSNLSDLMSTTESLMRDLFRNVRQLKQDRLPSLQEPHEYLPDGEWNRLDFIPVLQWRLGFELPDLSRPDSLEQLTALLTFKGHPVEPGVTLNKLLDQLAATHLEPDSLRCPIFITKHPACMSPLAKAFDCPKTGQRVSARAELFIRGPGDRGHEVANMYEEENDPRAQRRKFELQAQARRQSGDAEDGPLEVDESYVQALEFGLPPTGGWGCGIDRLVMLLAGSSRISDTLSFGNLKNVTALSQAAKDS
ncbi:lysyl-tRNA synthetase [Xylariomycetidae sp. FL0641]|nr:lysyl-tRNA synthetase [Xylariomycetidae sp. FL0641]